MAEPTIRVDTLRGELNDANDMTFGCGQPPVDYQPERLFKTGTVCAGAGAKPSCALCPHSPSYHRLDNPAPVPCGPDTSVETWVIPSHEGLLDWGKDAGAVRGVSHWDYGRARPCRYCGASVQTRDAEGKPSCKVCAESNGQTNDDVAVLYRRSGDKHGA